MRTYNRLAKEKTFYSVLLLVTTLFSWFFVLPIKEVEAGINLPLIVQETAGISRVSEPITSGVPLPIEENITSVNQLKLTDSSGTVIPTQFTVTSRWNGEVSDGSMPIKWVLIDMQTDITADASKTLYLKSESQGNTTNTNLTILEDAGGFVIETGKAKFEISKNYFNLFDRVWIDSDGDGTMDNLIVDQVGQGGVVLIDKNGKQYTALLETPELIELEEEGPMRSVIHIRGVLKATDGAYFAPSTANPGDNPNYPNFSQPYMHSFVYYNARIHFYNNKDYVKTFFTLENNGTNGRTNPEINKTPVQMVYFDSMNLVLKTVLGSNINIHTEGVSDSITSSENLEIWQSWNENSSTTRSNTLETLFADGPYYSVKKTSSEVGNGKLHPGWLDLNDENQGISLGIRHFWQNFPKRITANANELIIGFWPEDGYYPYCSAQYYADATEIYPSEDFDWYCVEAGYEANVYLFDAGRHKTYEFVLRFYNGSYNNEAHNLSQSLEYPLTLLAEPNWYASTECFGPLAPAIVDFGGRELNEAMDRFNRYQRAKVNESFSDTGLTIHNLKTATPAHWEFNKQNRFFNWMNFGDLIWSTNSPSALHYDWTYIMFVHYLRTGDKNFFDRGVEMVKHRYDIDQYHGDGKSLWIGNMAFYESSGHADPNLHYGHPSKVSMHSHTWAGGLLMYYLMTGDRKALEAAEENGQAVLNHYGAGGLYDATIVAPSQNETRHDTWATLNAIQLYRTTGKRIYLETAKNIIKNLYLTREQWVMEESGIGGYIGYGDDIDGDGVNDFDAGTGKYEVNGSILSSVLVAYAMEALVAVHQETQDEDIKQLLIRTADFIKDHFLFGGDFNDKGKYRPIQHTWVWHKTDPDGSIKRMYLVDVGAEGDSAFFTLRQNYSGETALKVFWPDFFAYVYTLTNDPVYLGKARQCFKDGMLYFGLGAATLYSSADGYYLSEGYINTNSRSVVSFIEPVFPNSRTKVHGYIGRTNQTYLNIEWKLLQEAVELATVELADASINAGYQAYLSAFGGKPDYNYSITAGYLPNGLTLDSATGLISGMPTESGIFTFTIQVQDSLGGSDSKNVTLGVKFNIVTKTLSNGITNNIYSNFIQTSGATEPVTFALLYGEMPTGLGIDAMTGEVYGTPTEIGTYYFSIKVTDTNNVQVVQPYTVHINSETYPVADFIATPMSGNTPLDVTFTNNSVNGVTYHWNFGNGTTSTEENPPVHTYDTKGDYSVTLTVTNDLSEEDSITKTISVADPYEPVAGFEATPTSGDAPLIITIINHSSNYDMLEWDFNNDGVIDSTTQETSFTYTYNTPGTYTISLNATNNTSGKTDKETKIDLITVTGFAEPPTEELVKIKADCSGEGNQCFSSLSDFIANFGNIDFGTCADGDLYCSNKMVKVECYNDWPQGLEDSFSINGWITSDRHYIHIYTPETEKHNGKIVDGSGNYTGFALKMNGNVSIYDDYSVVEGIIFDMGGKDYKVRLGYWSVGGNNSVFRNNITYNGRYRHVELGDIVSVQIYNNFIIDDLSLSSDYGIYGAIDVGSCRNGTYHQIYNNTLYLERNLVGIEAKSSENDHLEIKNNLCVKTTGSYPCYQDVNSDYFENNISTDDSGNIPNMSVSDLNFISSTSGALDLHISEGSNAADMGSDLSAIFTGDIDGEERSGTWDIGADEIVSGDQALIKTKPDCSEEGRECFTL